MNVYSATLLFHYTKKKCKTKFIWRVEYFAAQILCLYEITVSATTTTTTIVYLLTRFSYSPLLYTMYKPLVDSKLIKIVTEPKIRHFYIFKHSERLCFISNEPNLKIVFEQSYLNTFNINLNSEAIF